MSRYKQKIIWLLIKILWLKRGEIVNILILANWYPNKNNPINGIFIKDQVRALMEAGLKPIVFFLMIIP